MSGITIPDVFVAAEDVTTGKPAYVLIRLLTPHDILTSHLINADPIHIFWERGSVMSDPRIVSFILSLADSGVHHTAILKVSCLRTRRPVSSHDILVLYTRPNAAGR